MFVCLTGTDIYTQSLIDLMSYKYMYLVYIYITFQAKKPGVCIYYTNRALCHLKCRRWDSVCQDCRAALEIDPLQVCYS